MSNFIIATSLNILYLGTYTWNGIKIKDKWIGYY
jgi:hypothetical protein